MKRKLDPVARGAPGTKRDNGGRLFIQFSKSEASNAANKGVARRGALAGHEREFCSLRAALSAQKAVAKGLRRRAKLVPRNA